MLEMKNIKKIYRTDRIETHALSDFSLHVEEGEFVSVMGPSGSGKTTFLNVAGLLDTFEGGQYILAGKDVSRLSDREMSKVRNEKIGFVFQSFNLIPDLNVFDNVDVPLRYRGMSGSERRSRIEKAVEMVGLSSRMKHLPSQLSGGQQQRVAIARVLAGDPKLILADEPTGNLDSLMAREIMDLLDHDTTVHEQHATRHLSRETHLVSHDDHRHALLREVTHDVEHLLDHLRVERAGRLVEEHDLRVHRQPARDGDALLLPAGKLLWEGACLVGNTDALQQRARRGLRLRARDALDAHRGQADVVQYREVGEEVELLEYHADLGAQRIHVCLRIMHRATEHVDLPAVNCLQPVDAAQERALARARRPTHDDHLARTDATRDTLQHLDVPESLVDLGEDDRIR